MSRHYKRGFTIIELLVIAPLVLVVIGIFIGVIVSLTGKALISTASSTMIHQSNAAAEQISRDINLSQGFSYTNSITPLQSPQGSDNGIQDFTINDNSILIINTYATSGVGHSSRTLAWLKDSPNSCSSGELNKNPAMMINIVYFIKDKTLWRRTILPNDYQTAGCQAPIERPSCAPPATATLCKTRDEKILSDINNLSVSYFSDRSATTAITNPDSQTVLDTALSINMTYSALKNVAGQDISHSATFQAARLND